jgi:hypothetical protein
MKRMQGMLRRPAIWFWLAALGIGLLYWRFNGWDKHDHIPEWIQAGGSVLAIIGAFWIGDSTRRAEQVQKRQAIGAVVQAAQDFSDRIRDVIQRSNADAGIVEPSIYDIYHEEVTKALADALSKIPLHELGSPAAVQAVLYLHGQFAHFLPPDIDKFIAGPDKHPDFKDSKHSYDDLPQPQRGQKQKMLRIGQFNVLAGNVLVHLNGIDRECGVCLRELGFPVAPATKMKTVSK